MPGPGKKPTALKVLAGNPGKKPLPEGEPNYGNADLMPPEWLTEGAKARWEPLARALQVNGLLNEANREVLAGYVTMVAEFARKVEQTGEADLKLMQQIRLVAREFGFTPSSQAGIATPGKKQADDGKGRFFKAG
ncbi:P27 family phage terminase small subunit [Marinobacter salinexigens]|uniref:P27 family phage terminase small subunit n=1 Tax=Marinobacter salinexigens TaxID=2919747 RepID=A0A5B0VAE3_9GAMM|nr:P27 family phage terminase small subunit [Marinobacter salinexigens]KAA1171041.1 P27 family phage terminase small subunit [Marinobacter salinexigens]